jgi:predicted MFS family arabinose efflux permease
MTDTAGVDQMGSTTVVSEKLAIGAYSVMGALPFSVLLFLPMFIGGFVTELGFTESTAGYVGSINIAGFGLAAFAAFWWIRHYSIKDVLRYAFIIFIVCNFISFFATSFVPLAVVRLLEGLAAGTISAGIVASIAKLPNSDRNYGIWLAVQLLYGTIGFIVIPFLFNAFGVMSGYGMIGLLALLCYPLIRYVPNSVGAEEQTIKTASFKILSHPGWGVASLLAFYIGLNIVWAYLERIGNDAGLSLETIGFSLSIANFAGLVGAIIVALIGLRFGRAVPVTIGLIVTALSVFPLLNKPDAFVYTSSTSVYLFGWCFLVPFILGAIAELDESGKYVALGNAAIGIGLSLGPAIGAILVGDGEGYSKNIYLASGLMLLSLILIWPILLKKKTAE